MQVNRKLRSTVVATVAALAVGAPAASAVPLYDGHPPLRATGEAYDVNRETGAYIPASASADMHASTVTERPYETTVTATDLRTEAAKSPIESQIDRGDVVVADVRTEAAKDPAGPTPPVGMPTWPVDPKPIVPAAPEPVSATDDGNDPVDWPLVGLILAGTAAMAGAALVLTRRPTGHAR